jgi:catechol 2,3-dioxygenase-like lactoylglutathione lyase family enzyme
MLSDNAVTATIPVRSLARAKAFYGGTLGLEAAQENPSVVTYRSGPSTLMVYESAYAGTNRATAATWTVDDVEGLARELRARGVVFEHYNDLPGLKASGNIHLANDGEMKVAWLKDPDGNILSIVGS